MNNLGKDRIITFTIPDNITPERFFHRNTDMFEWAKNATEVRSDIIHDTTKHIYFESQKIMDSIPHKNAESTEMKGENGKFTTQGNTEDCDVSDAEGAEESLGDSGSILDILTAEELETPLIKDHFEVLKRWQKEDSDENFFGGKANVAKLEMGKGHKARKTGLKQVRWFERLNALKKCYIVTKPENILPFQLMIPRGALQTGKIYQDLKIRLKWVTKALPQTTPGNPSYILIQPIYNQNDKNADLSQLSGYIYLRQVFKSMLRVGGLESNR